MTDETPRLAIGHGYTLRKATELDRPLLCSWIEADPFHRGRVLPDFFLRCVKGEDAWVLENRSSTPVFFFKTQTVARLHIQFGPAASHQEKTRNALAMSRGMQWLEERLAENGFREVVFDTNHYDLAEYTKSMLGFQQRMGEFSRYLPTIG